MAVKFSQLAVEQPTGFLSEPLFQVGGKIQPSSLVIAIAFLAFVNKSQRASYCCYRGKDISENY